MFFGSENRVRQDDAHNGPEGSKAPWCENSFGSLSPISRHGRSRRPKSATQLAKHQEHVLHSIGTQSVGAAAIPHNPPVVTNTPPVPS
jgi:hypothetical protein